MSPSTNIDAVLFDLGGVLMAIDWRRVFAFWGTHSSLSIEQMEARFEMDEPYRRHERGEISGREYFAHLREIMEYRGPDADFIAGWNAILVGEIDDNIAAVRQVSPTIPIFGLTNTNNTHHAVWSVKHPVLFDLCEEIFVSSKLGMRKPEAAMFDHVIARIGADPGRILFFDDAHENIAGAKSRGLSTVHVTDPDEVTQGLRAYQLIP
ncbi:MAG: HAD family phosphatase [Pseudomonadota bacterium]